MGILRTNTLSGLETPTPVTGSVSFDGTGDYLTLASSGDFAFGTGDFTIECWAYFTTLNSENSLTSTHNSDANWTWKVVSNKLRIYTGTTDVDGTSTITTGSWFHFAVSRQSSTLRLFVNGINETTTTSSNNYTINNTLHIGAQQNNLAGTYINGFISNLRVLKGTALYTGSFIPPTRELQPIGDTVLLCCNNPDSAGAEATGKTITANGDAVASTFSPGLTRDFTYGTQFDGVSRFDTQGYFVPPSGNTQNRYTLGLDEIVTSGLVLHLDAGNPFSYPVTGVGTKWTDLSGNNNHGTLTNGVSYTDNNRGALVFDGVNDYVSGTITPLTGNYTIEIIFKLITSNAGDNSLIALTGPNAHGFLGEVSNSDKKIRFLHRFPYGNSGGDSFFSSGSINLNQIYSISWVRDSNQKIYINGGFDSQITSTTSGFDSSLTQLTIGQLLQNSSARIINGNVYSTKIYNRALSAAEVSQNYEALKGRYGLP